MYLISLDDRKIHLFIGGNYWTQPTVVCYLFFMNWAPHTSYWWYWQPADASMKLDGENFEQTFVTDENGVFRSWHAARTMRSDVVRTPYRYTYTGGPEVQRQLVAFSPINFDRPFQPQALIYLSVYIYYICVCTARAQSMAPSHQSIIFDSQEFIAVVGAFACHWQNTSGCFWLRYVFVPIGGARDIVVSIHIYIYYYILSIAIWVRGPTSGPACRSTSNDDWNLLKTMSGPIRLMAWMAGKMRDLRRWY